MVYVRIFQKPLNIKVYSSLTALIEDNDLQAIGASESKLRKHKFAQYDYITHKVIISRREALTSGDVRRANDI